MHSSTTLLFIESCWPPTWACGISGSSWTQFHILTDHKLLTQALHRISEPLTARQHRQLSYIAEHTATSGIWSHCRTWWPTPFSGRWSRYWSLPQPVQAGTAGEARLK